MPWRLEQYRILNAGPDYLKILQNGVKNIVSINRATLTSAEHIGYETTQYRSVRNHKRENLQSGKQQDEVNNAQKGDTYVVDMIIQHSDTPEKQSYFVHWYGYTSADDKMELEENLPQHFIDRYWKVL